MRLIRIAEDRTYLLSLKLEIARLRRDRYGASVERSTWINQLELTLEELDETLAETDAQAASELEACATAVSS